MEVEKQFLKLVEMMARLRSPDGCPWDKEQSHSSIAPYCLEEAYEVVEAIDEQDPSKLKDELGDLLLQVVFHAQMAKEAGTFTLADVIGAIHDKLIRRHPHVFDRRADSATTSKEVLENWSQIKKKEGRKHLLDGIPKALPALLRATRIGDKAASVGFDWKDSGEVWKKVEEEISELKSAGSSRREEELGDLFFSLVQWSRHLQIDSEGALRKATEKFGRRFRKMEENANRENKEVHDFSSAELEDLWNAVKKAESNPA